MTDYYLFGTYRNLIRPLDPEFTADRSQAKWRSQVSLLNDSAEPVAPLTTPNSYYLLDNLVYIVAISDLDYLLRSTEPVDDSFRIKRGQGGTRVDREFFVGKNAQLDFAYFESDFTPPTASHNTNPFPKPTAFPKPLVNLDYLKFSEERLELGVNYGSVGGMSFDTAITEVANDREQRNINRYLPLGRWQLGFKDILESELDKLEEFSYLKTFHNDRLGSFEGFRFKDWSDYQATNEVIAVGDGIQTQFQLRKAYRAGNAVTYRPIMKPVLDTVDILVDDLAQADWDIDYTTGVVSHPDPLAAGAVLTASFEFDVPVWFESDEIGFKLAGYEPDNDIAIYRLESVFVVEGRIPLALPWDISPIPEITENLDLGIIYDTIEKYSHSTNKLALKSGYTRKEAKRAESKLFFDLGGRNYDSSELEKILGYFYCAKGKAGEFPMVNLGKNYKVRFNQDNLNLRFEAKSSEDALFNLSGLKIQIEGQHKLTSQFDFSLLYGHFGFLETANNGNFYNYYLLEQNYFVGQGQINSVITLASNSEDKVFKSTAYLTNRQIESNLSIPYSKFEGITLIFSLRKILDNNYNLINSAGFSLGYYSFNAAAWYGNIFGQSFSLNSINPYLPLNTDFSITISITTTDISIYVDGVLDLQHTFTGNAVFEDGKTLFYGSGDFIRNNIQIWKKALTQEEIVALHPDGVRSFFRPSTPKDSGIAKLAIITPEDNNYGYTSDAVGSLLVANTLNTNLPSIVDNNYYRFENSASIEIASNDVLPTILASVFRHFTGFNNPAEGINYLALYATASDPSNYVLIATEPRQSRFIIVKQASSGRNLQYHPYPTEFVMSDFHEIFVKFPSSPTEDATVVLDGAILPKNSIVNLVGFDFGAGVFGAGNVFNVPNRLDKGTPDFDLRLAFCNVNANGIVSNLLTANSYTAQNTIEYQAARLFYQMGFKKSLATLEPNNIRLLAGDYPI